MGLFSSKKVGDKKIEDDLPEFTPKFPQLPPLPTVKDFSESYNEGLVPALENEKIRIPLRTEESKEKRNYRKQEENKKRGYYNKQERYTKPEYMKTGEPDLDKEQMYMKEEYGKPEYSKHEFVEKPLFIKVDKYRDAMEAIDNIKKRIKEAEHLLTKLEVVKDDEEKELKKFREHLESVKDKLLMVDKKLFEV